jgi:F0F1-type ATP synthase assembly protein I
VSNEDNGREDDRSPIAKALSQVAQITTISLMMVIPAIIGQFIDRLLGTVILFTALGLVLGMASAIWQLIKLVSYWNKSYDSEDSK